MLPATLNFPRPPRQVGSLPWSGNVHALGSTLLNLYTTSLPDRCHSDSLGSSCHENHRFRNPHGSSLWPGIFYDHMFLFTCDASCNAPFPVLWTSLTVIAARRWLRKDLRCDNRPAHQLQSSECSLQIAFSREDCSDVLQSKRRLSSLTRNSIRYRPFGTTVHTVSWRWVVRATCIRRLHDKLIDQKEQKQETSEGEHIVIKKSYVAA